MQKIILLFLITVIPVFAHCQSEFKNAPEEYYKGNNVCVTGKITIYKGKPEIVLNNESQIEIQ